MLHKYIYIYIYIYYTHTHQNPKVDRHFSNDTSSISGANPSCSQNCNWFSDCFVCLPPNLVGHKPIACQINGFNSILWSKIATVNHVSSHFPLI